MKIAPARRITGRVFLPGDKSISHRAAIISALAMGTSHLSNFSTSKDCASTLTSLGQLGVSLEQNGSMVRIEGAGETGFRQSEAHIDCGNSGSTVRMLAGVLAAENFSSTLIGDRSLSNRPMKRVIEPLELMGARIQSRGGRLPLSIKGTRPLKAIRYELPVPSAQVKSCVLLAGLRADGQTEVVETFGSTRDHTERMLNWFGVPVACQVAADRLAAIRIAGPVRFGSRDVEIPGDISSAAFLIVAAALLAGSELVIETVGLNPTRIQFLLTLRSLGLEVNPGQLEEHCNEPVGTVRIRASSKPDSAEHARRTLISGPLISQMIDELPLLAIVGTQISGGIEIRDAAELRYKETDRIKATVKNLLAMGAEVEEFDDGLAVAGPVSLRAASLESFGDHRIAMAFTIAALLADGESDLAGGECVDISFPEFFQLLDSLADR